MNGSDQDYARDYAITLNLGSDLGKNSKNLKKIQRKKISEFRRYSKREKRRAISKH